MSRGLGFVQASILRHLTALDLTGLELGPDDSLPAPMCTARELCEVVYEHEDDEIERHLPAVRRALYGLEELGLVECVGDWLDEPGRRGGAPSRVWQMTWDGYERAQQGLIINVPRTPARDRQVEQARAEMSEQLELLRASYAADALAGGMSPEGSRLLADAKMRRDWNA